MKKNLLFCFLLFCFNTAVSSQSAHKTAVALDSANVLIDLANENILASQLEKSLDYSIKAVSLANTSQNKEAIAEAYICLANSYQIAEDEENAKKHFRIALKLGQETNNLFALIASTNGLGNAFSKDPETIEQSIAYYEQSVAYTLQSNEPARVFIATLNTATMFLDHKRPDKALGYIEKAIESYSHYEKKVPLYDLTLDFVQGTYFMQKKNYSMALAYLDKSLAVAMENNYVLDLIDIYKTKSEIYQELGDFNLAIENLKKFQEYNALNFDAEKGKQIEEMNAKFKVTEFERELMASKKEQEILAQLTESQNKMILYTVIGIAMLLAVIGLMIYNYKNRQNNYKLKIHNQVLEAAKNNAERLTALKSKFISRVSHELRTPLYGVVGITSMLQEDNTLSEKHGELIKALRFSGDHLINLVNNVLKLSQIESQNIKLNLTNTNIRLLMTNIINSFQFQSKHHDNSLKLIISDDVLDYYKIDSVRFSEILINLLANAIKFTSNGAITVTVTSLRKNKNKQRIFFEVKDTGKGILKDHQDSIFDNFNQINDEENTYEGAGLGLTIVKHLLELMGSEISLESTILEGSTFSFVLELEEGKQQTRQSQPNYTTIKPKKILIAEDNKISQMVTSNLIKLIGHEYVIAENGVEAFQKVQHEKFDLVLMDLNMPLMNGYEAAKEIKLIAPDLKIIALTATEIAEVKDKCFKTGMVEVINKPLGKNELHHVINRYLLEEQSKDLLIKDRTAI